MTAPSAFSEHLPTLQRAWDATSLNSLMFCPTYYKRTHIEGWRGSKVDLEFGGYAASSFAKYRMARIEGKSKAEAQAIAVLHALRISGHYHEDENGERQWVPWGGEYLDMWRCKGETPFKNAKGNRAKCPWSYKGKWFPGEGPSTCGRCGSETETERRWLPEDNKKDRHALIRLIVWWTEEQPEDLDNAFHTIHLPDGRPGVEYHFMVPTPWTTPFGEPYILTGYFDEVGALGDEVFINDDKTTKGSLGKSYWQRYAPNVQVDWYDVAGQLLFPQLGIRGVRISAAQTLVGGARFGSHFFYRTEEQREETLAEIEWWIRQAERYAEADHWPMNKANCRMCVFNEVCALPASQRERKLEAEFTKDKWNPLEAR